MDGTEELVVEGVEGAEGAKELVGEDGVEGTEDGICGGESPLRHDKLKSGFGSLENYSRTECHLSLAYVQNLMVYTKHLISDDYSQY
jgi:hypothetical protein